MTRTLGEACAQIGVDAEAHGTCPTDVAACLTTPELSLLGSERVQGLMDAPP